MKNKQNENYLEKIPVRELLNFTVDEAQKVTLEKENKGFFNKIAQMIFKKPKISFIHLDDFGSFVWLQIDGEKNILKIGEAVKEKFGKDAEPLYERLSQYFVTLESYGFVKMQ